MWRISGEMASKPEPKLSHKSASRSGALSHVIEGVEKG
jgi:hypothetical protein